MRPGTAGRWAATLTALFISAAGAQERLAQCAACHGAGGVSGTPGTPSLAGQPALFVENQLVLIREGIRRVTPGMEAAVKGLSDREIRALAAYYAGTRPPPLAPPRDAALARHGARLAAGMHCGECHLPDFSGQRQIPRLAGQREEYLAEAMRAYRDYRRSGGDTIMAAALYGVSDAEIRALAHYLAHRRR